MLKISIDRRKLGGILLLFSIANIAACRPNQEKNQEAQKIMDQNKKEEIFHFNVNLYSYLERPIFDVYLNGKFIGDAAGQPHRGNGGIITGVPVPLGPQVVSWRLDGPQGMPGNGETVHASNTPILTRPDPHLTYLGVHIYPDNTVEIIPEKFWPEKTEKGKQINKKWESEHGK